MLWKSIVLLLSFLSLSFTVQAENDLSKALDDAGMQRSLSLQIAKDYLLESLYGNARQYIREREEAEALFEAKLQNLKTFAQERNDAPLSALLVQVQGLWHSYRLIIDKDSDYDNAKTVVQASNNLLHLCDQVVEHIEQVGIDAGMLLYLETAEGKKVSYLNIAGKQRTGSQRIALYLAADRLGLRDIDAAEQLQTAINDFDSGMRDLYAASQNSARTDELIGQAIDTWKEIKEETLSSEKAKLPKSDFESFDVLMQKIDEISYLYEKALNTTSVSQR